jgi:preprotein translocase SecE subunit
MGFIQYVKDTRNELRHVAWPTRTQTTVFTAFVMALSVVVALYLGVFDYVFTQGLERVLERVAPPAQTAEVPQGLIEIATSSETGAETESNPIIIE